MTLGSGTRAHSLSQPGERKDFSSEAPVRLSDADCAALHRRRLDAQVRFQSRRFLPFKECCEWVRRNFGFLSRDEWEEWVSQGEGLSPYIPTRPDEFYSRLGQWRGWSFFLRGIEDADDDPGAGSVIS